ncbi:MAG: NAD(P)/FAD-dependent oxidoreductase [Gaiellales bacterium]
MTAEDGSGTQRVDAIVVGAGASGLYALQRLRELGFSVRVLEAADGVGGTWWWNRYPGARCDIESMTYSYSFSEELQQEWTWTERYAAQPEILRYFEHVADRFDLRPDIQFATRVTSAAFDEDDQRWTVTTDRGDVLSASFLIMATGCLSVPRLPDIPGVERFTGEKYHTGLWPHERVDFAGKRVGIIGTGSSAIQALPIIAQDADHVTIFQRTPAFSVPAFNRPLDPEEVRERKARYPEYRQAERESGGGNPWLTREVSVFDETPQQRREQLETHYARGGFHLHAAYNDTFTDARANDVSADFVRDKIRERVHDPEVAELLCPYGYPFATKRMCIDTAYYEAYNRDNVRLVSVKQTPIEEITETGLRVGDEEHSFDMLVIASGFDAMTGALMAVDIRGRSGLSLREKWADGPQSYLGLTVAGFPNLFTITGPGSPSVLSNMIVSIEQHVDFVADCLVAMRERGLVCVEPTEEAERAWVDHVREIGEETLYPLAASWYMGANVPGKPRVLLPYVAGVGEYRRECEGIVERGYEGFSFRSRATAEAPAPR